MNIATKMAAAAAELIQSNADDIASLLASSPGGKLTVGISCKLTLIGGKTSGKLKISYSKKHSDEEEFVTDDPNQPELIGGGE